MNIGTELSRTLDGTQHRTHRKCATLSWRDRNQLCHVERRNHRRRFFPHNIDERGRLNSKPTDAGFVCRFCVAFKSTRTRPSSLGRRSWRTAGTRKDCWTIWPRPRAPTPPRFRGWITWRCSVATISGSSARRLSLNLVFIPEPCGATPPPQGLHDECDC